MSIPAHKVGNDLSPTTQLEERLRRIEQGLIRRRLLKSPGILPEEGPDGTRIKVDVKGGGQPGESSSVQQYKLTAIADDYIEAKTWDGTNLGATAVKIAKPWRLRKTGWHGVTVVYNFNGTNISISYAYQATPGYRAATRITAPSVVENQAIIPIYKVDDIIYATEPDGGTLVTVAGTALTWLDLNVDARAWARF